ncbi:MAG: cytochrome C552, partial [Gammaproteobacteria bacterium]|nr:cytochrome C552 [Gammaproteobacteria bacterium]
VEDGYILEQRLMSGGQGVEFTGGLENGTWTMVMKRKLKSDKPGDLSLDPGTVYNFGFAVHDDYSNARFHHVSLGYKLGFDNEDVHVNAVKRGVAAGGSAPAPVAQAVTPAPQDATAAAGAPASGGINWDMADERQIVLFYPGQSSMEWVLKGTDHGGARPFIKGGEPCTECHDQEADAMGQKIVTGEKLEPTVIEGKRGSIPVSVK